MAYESPLDPIRPNQPLSRRQLDRALGRINDIADMSVSGGQFSDEYGQGNLIVPSETRVTIRITGGGDDGRYDAEEVTWDSAAEEWQATGTRTWTEDGYAAVERNGNSGVPEDTVLEGLLDEVTGEVRFTFGSNEVFPVQLTERGYRNGKWVYGWREQRYKRLGQLEDKPDGRSGGAGGWIAVDTVHEGDPDIEQHETQSLSKNEITGGTWQLQIDGHRTEDIAWNATAGEVQAALEAAGCDYVTVSGTWLLTWDDYENHDEVTVFCDGIEPSPEHPAYELSNYQVGVDQYAFLRPGYVAKGISITKTEDGNGTDQAAVYEIVMDAIAGSFLPGVDGIEADDSVVWNPEASDIESALATTGYAATVTGTGATSDPFVVTFSDFADHTLTVDDGELVDASDYRFQTGGSSNDLGECLAALASPEDIPGFAEGVTLLLTYSSGTGCYRWIGTINCTEPD